MATELGKAYVQIIPSANGIKGNVEQVLGKPVREQGLLSGSEFGSALINTLKPILAGFSIGKVLSDSLLEGGKLQQSIGGIETLFGSSADTIKNYAKSAFRNAGVSANEYMEQTTSFAASLISSCGGNTAKAAEIANMALEDMSDNSNKFGTNMQDIQNAYQGFSKSNYTMLDNLKLGYSGTKSEMERLLKDAEKITGIHYDINNLGDVYNAIHAIQQQLKITGTTQEEATSTLSGSFGMLKASWKDFLGNIAIGENVFGSFKNVVSSLGTFLAGNLFPMFANIGKSISDVLVGVANSIPSVLPKMLDGIQAFATDLANQAPQFIKSGFEMLNKLADGIISGIPILIEKLPTIISTFANIINDNAPTVLICGIQLIGKLALGLIQAIPTLIANVPKIIGAIVDVWSAFNWLNVGKMAITGLGNGIKSLFGFLKSTGKEALDTVLIHIMLLPERLGSLGGRGISGLIGGIKSLFGSLSGAAGKISEIVVKAVSSLPSKMHSIGKNIVEGIWNGIGNMGGWIAKKISGFANGIINNFKKALDIHSPSKRGEKEVGFFLGKSIGTGTIKSLPSVKKDIDSFSDSVMNEFKNSNAFKQSMTFDAIKETRIQMSKEGFDFDNSNSRSGDINQTINITTPEATDPSENARQVRNATREMLLRLKGA